jgi:GAF domain-containing protein
MKQLDESLSLPAMAAALLRGETDATANMANLSALIFQYTKDINWAGFYILKDGELVLGPFQGKPACVRIKPGRGVCGAAAEQKKTIVVADVKKFPGHIACDAASRSEMVIPIIKKDGSLFGVLDIDSPLENRFGPEEKEIFEKVISVFTSATKL